ncbi:MAG: ABC transporter ATP-binding protein [Candidatus Gottesmanbacteria bacterium]
MSGSCISVSHLSKTFGNFEAVRDISFSVGTGEIVGLLGPNGAGKTTTIFMLLGLITPTSGSIQIFGLDFKNNEEQILQQLNYSSTYVEMAPRLTVMENLKVMARLYQVKNAKEKITTYSKKFELEEFLNKRHATLSQGQKTRVYLAKAFLNSPKLLLLDEPTASLDPDVAELVRKEIIDARAQGMTILLTSHNMAEVEEVCDRVLFINHGKIVAEDTPEQLAKKVRQIRVNLMMIDGQKRTIQFAEKSGFPIVTKGRYVTISVDEQDIAFLLAGLAELGVRYSEISVDKPTLEDYFIKMTHKKGAA